MRVGKRTLLVCLLLAGSLPATAAPDAEAALPVPEAAAGACAPPCGYIIPLIDLDFPEKPACGNPALGGDGECIPLPARDGSVSYDGVLRWYWEVSQDGTYPNDPQQPIVVSFSGTGSNPDFLEVAVEPPEFQITTADLFTPTNLKQDASDPAKPRVWFWYERPVTVTLTRTGDPTAEEIERAEQRRGNFEFHLKVKSSASSDRYREAFGLETFRFEGASVLPEEGGSEDTPLPAPWCVLAAIVATAATLRRRR